MKNLDQQFWNQRYAEAQTGWDIGSPSTPLKEYIDVLRDKNQRILIPGCGNAYEAEYLLQQGFTNITLIDIAPLVVEQVSNKFKTAIEAGSLDIICGDFFALQKTYDLILEQTFFCAISPELRPVYAQHMHSLLNPGGKLVGVLFNRVFESRDEAPDGEFTSPSGPPFGGNQEEYESYFLPLFETVKMDPCYNSVAPRAGSELFIQLQKSQSQTT